MQKLQLPARTFYRYLSAVFQDDDDDDGRLLAEKVSDKEAVNQMQMAICRDRLLSQRRDIVEQIVRKNR